MLPDWRKPEKHAVENIGTTEIHASGKGKAAVSDISRTWVCLWRPSDKAKVT